MSKMRSPIQFVLGFLVFIIPFAVSLVVIPDAPPLTSCVYGGEDVPSGDTFTGPLGVTMRCWMGKITCDGCPVGAPAAALAPPEKNVLPAPVARKKFALPTLPPRPPPLSQGPPALPQKTLLPTPTGNKKTILPSLPQLPPRLTCDFKGEIIGNGDTVTGPHGITHLCSFGRLYCSECPNVCKIGPMVFMKGTVMNAADGCNICRCTKYGHFVCTKLSCAQMAQIRKILQQRQSLSPNQQRNNTTV